MRCRAYEENSFSGAKDTKMELHRKSGLKIPGEKRTGPQSEEISSHRTFGVGAREAQLLDLRGPRHGRQHLEGVLAVDLAVANVELQQSPKHLEVLELACMRPRGREVEKRVGSALSATPKNGNFHKKSGLVRN